MPKDVLPITPGSTDVFFAAGEALGGDVAGLHGEVKSERSVTAFKSPARVSVLNPEGGTVHLRQAQPSSSAPGRASTAQGGLRLGAGALILRVRHRLVQMSKPRQKSKQKLRSSGYRVSLRPDTDRRLKLSTCGTLVRL